MNKTFNEKETLRDEQSLEKETENLYLTSVEREVSDVHRSKWIVHRRGFYFAEFNTKEQLDFFARNVGFQYTLVSSKDTPHLGRYDRYDMNRDIRFRYFYTMDEVPTDAKPIKALCSGSIVTCYFQNDGRTITWHRPNPNSTLFKPLSIEDHIAHVRIYGLY